MIFKVLSGEGIWRQVKRHYCDGVKKTRRIRLDNGAELEGSFRHKVRLVSGKWKKLIDVVVGDLIEVRRQIPQRISRGEFPLPPVKFNNLSKLIFDVPNEMESSDWLYCVVC